ncbi:MAG: DUF1294 domain-containing protein [Polyangiaceae bacterium]|nr:DUF1294 domain-containing protein [Polyangiaceae bacterium]
MAIHICFEANIWLAWFLAVNLVTLLTYAYDKRIAGSGGLRVPETTLLGLALVGGTPGAILAMQYFRHKTAKRSFKTQFRLVVVVQVVLLIGYLCWTLALPRVIRRCEHDAFEFRQQHI